MCCSRRAQRGCKAQPKKMISTVQEHGLPSYDSLSMSRTQTLDPSSQPVGNDLSSPTTFPIVLTSSSTDIRKPFPYHNNLSQLQITPQLWTSISLNVQAAAGAISGQQATSCRSRRSRGPLIRRGVIAGFELAVKRMQERSRQPLLLDESVEAVMQEWNEALFAPRGFAMDVVLSSPELLRQDLRHHEGLSHIEATRQGLSWCIVIDRKMESATEDVSTAGRQYELEKNELPFFDVDEHMYELSQKH